MNAREKARVLVDKYRNVRWDIDIDTSKQCALIAVDELIEHTDWTEFDYWKQVKQEIEKL